VQVLEAPRGRDAGDEPARAVVRRAQKRRGRLVPWLFLAPALIMYGWFFIWPALDLVRLSLLSWDGLGPKTFVGLDNYERLLGDRLFWRAFRHNVGFLLAGMVVPVTIGLVLAVALSRSRLYGRVFFRTVFFLPQVLSSVTVAIIWGWIYNPSFGALNVGLETLGLGFLQQRWLGSTQLVLPSLFIAWSWVHYGFTMVIFIAAIDGIDETYFEAAKVDGAGGWWQFWHVIVPFIRAPLTTVVLLTAIAAMQVFDLVFVLTNGGPARASIVIPLYMIDNAFFYTRVGYASAIAVVLAAVILVLSLVFLTLRGAFRYEGEA
jgi:raffinose/stachyose/melibiose transport system permease protein